MNIQNKNLKQKTASAKRQQTTNYSIGEIVFLCLSNWYWFVLSALITTSYAVYGILTTQPVYTRTSQIHIESGKRGNTLSEQMENFANMGTFRISTNAYNEIYTFRAPETITETARRLKSYIEYSSKGTFHNKVLYGETLPVTVTLCDIDIADQASLDVNITPEGKFSLTNFNSSTVADNSVIEGSFDNDSITLVVTPIGDIILERNNNCRFYQPTTVNVRQTGLAYASAVLGSKLSFTLDGSDKKIGDGEIINIRVNDHSIERADDILDMVVRVYNENWVKDKNRAAEGTEKFINKRLEKISGELDKIESDITTFKSDNQLPDLESSIAAKVSTEKENIKRKKQLEDELKMGEYILSNIKDKAKENNLLPINAGINNTNINSQITSYNSTMLERNNLANKSSKDNPSVKEADITLASMRNAIISSINTHIRSLKAQLDAVNKEVSIVQKEIAKNPEQTTFLASAERELSVKEKIYMFLLQKQAENQLSQAFTAYNTRVISPPNGSLEPTAPQKERKVGMALLIGLIIPGLIIIIKEVTNTKVRGRKDLETLTAPIIGEIPKVNNLESKKEKGKKKKGREKLIIAVEEGSRNIINEAFRVLRTNIEFMTRERDNNVIIFTSFNPGSGKTFCVINTAISLALKNDKILLIDGDMRHASLSNYAYSPDKGLSDYLAEEISDIKETIIQDEKYNSLHILPVGTIPPNPTELLESPRFEELIKELKKEYRYILIDCPPIDIIADTHIIEKYADNSFFLVRANLMERSMINELEDIYREKKLNNLSVILNGVETKGSRYGYRYGYHYGYHYGSYAYGSDKKSKKKR